jgi:CRISPR-associated protein Csx3
MATYLMQLDGDTLRVDFAKTDEEQPIPADGDVVVRDVQTRARQMIASGELSGGNLLKIRGRISVGASYTLAHEVAHLYRAVAVADTRLGAYVVVSSTTPEYPFGCRIDFRTGEVTEVKSTAELSAPSFFIRCEGDVLSVQINNAVQVGGDQIVRDAKVQLRQLINSGQLPGGKFLKVNGRSTVLASFVIALELAHCYSAIAVFDPKIGDRNLDRYIVTISHTPDYQVGGAIDVERAPCQTVKVVLCGFPNTGKTVFRDGLKEAILEREDAPPDFYAISGCPDGDGCWFSQTAQKYPELAQQLKAEYKAKFTPEFAAAKARDIEVNKNSLLLFDVGGKMSPENELIMAQATHAAIIAKSELEVAQWQGFCQKLNLPAIAVIYSDIKATADEIQTESPQLLGTVHQLIRGQSVKNRPVIQALAKKLVELVREG